MTQAVAFRIGRRWVWANRCKCGNVYQITATCPDCFPKVMFTSAMLAGSLSKSIADIQMTTMEATRLVTAFARNVGKTQTMIENFVGLTDS